MKDIKSNVTEEKENWEKMKKKGREKEVERQRQEANARFYQWTLYFFPILNSPLPDLCLYFVFNVP